MKKQIVLGRSGLILACALLTTAAYMPATDQPANPPSGSSVQQQTAVVLRFAVQSQSMTDAAALSSHACAEDNGGSESSATAPALGDAAAPDNLTADPKTLDATPLHQSKVPASSDQAGASATQPKEDNSPSPNLQPLRILGVMPNFRAVSAGTLPPPPSPNQAFVIATHDSFDYSAFAFVGIVSLLAEATNKHPQLGKGLPGFGRYYWRGFADKTDGNYLVMLALPTVFHQDERYYALGKGSFLRRLSYSATRVIITPSYQGHNSFNASELVGRGISQAISLAYYPSGMRTPGGIGSKFGYAIARDVLGNTFREFWPDIAAHVLHHHP